MNMKPVVMRLLLTLGALALVQSCSSVPQPPTCDGFSKRPINGRGIANVTKKVTSDEGCSTS